jgi:CDP-diacylglycerol---glycerol-3-phosphate 3-phosphatidyltransferase
MQAFTPTLSLTLTLSRLFLSPLIMPLGIALLIPLNSLLCNIVLAVLFIALSLTDFFDGYLARKYNQETALGKMLDPLADKFLVFSTLIALVYVHRIFFYWALIIIGREFFVTGLRECALHYGFTLPVFFINKLKAACQMLYLTWVLLNPYPYYASIELVLLSITLVLTIISALYCYRYFIRSLAHLKIF